MQKYLGLAFAAMLASSFSATAQQSSGAQDEKLILVELFTSQGCYSCPPADKILEQMTQVDGILPLSLHVDYWDYLGWKDDFAIAKFGERQASYNAQIIKRGRRVTPQMVFNGVAEVAGGVGRSVEAINMTLETLKSHKEAADIEIERNGRQIVMSLSTQTRGLGPADISLVRYTPAITVKIDRGENAGKTLTYHNVVRSLEIVDRWDTRKTKTLEVTLPETKDAFAVIVQGKRFGPVFVARNLVVPGES
ncbi:MAG: DUF1223 domain-containing protein [Pseudomonadota bacterium]